MIFMHKLVRYAVFAAIAFISIFLFILNRDGFPGGGYSGIHISDTASVNRIEIYGKDTISLIRSESGNWILNGKYRANPVCISNFLFSFMKMNIRGISYQLDSADTLSLRIKVFAGKKKYFFRFYPSDKNDLIHREGDKKICSVNIPGTSKTNLSQVFSDDPDYWKDHTIMDFLPEEISMIKVEHPLAPGNDFIIRVENKFPVLYEPDGKKMVPAEKLDTVAVNMYISYFINIFYDQTVKGKLPERKSFTELPQYIITVTPFAGEPVRISVYPIIKDKQEDIFRVGIRLDESAEMLLVRYIAIDLILRKKSDFFWSSDTGSFPVRNAVLH